MLSVIQNRNTKLLNDPITPTVNELSCHQNSNCPLAEKWLSECFVYNAQVYKSDLKQIKNHNGTWRHLFKRLLKKKHRTLNYPQFISVSTDT